jgi:choline-sulfatase
MTAVAAAAQAGPTSTTKDQRPPNLLFICSDTHQPDFAGYRGHPMIKTPNLDRLARQGTHFTNCYCGSPLCVPARASLLTGMFPSDVDSWCNSTPFQGQVPTWANRLRDRGYYCQATGKMDLWSTADLGFDEVGTSHGHQTSPDVTSLFRRPLCYRVDERRSIDGHVTQRVHSDQRVLENTLEFLREDAPKLDRPWAMYVGFTAPLPRFRVARRYFEMYPPDRVPVPEIPPGYLERMPEPWQATRAYKRIATPIPEDRVRRARAAYFGLITELDERVGRLLALLEQQGLGQNTLVVYTSDHGQSMGEHGMWFHNEPTDRSSRVPLIVSGPGILEAGRVDTPVMHADLYPTFLDAVGASVPSGLRGHSLLPLCAGQAGGHPGFAYSECHAEGTCTGSFIIRQGRWKYIHYSYYDDLLFDVESDPEEFHNVIDTPEGRKARRELHEILLSLVDPTAVTERAFARQERMLAELCDRMTLDELLAFGFERRLGRGQAITLLKKYKG